MENPGLRFYPGSGSDTIFLNAAANAPVGFPLSRYLPTLPPGMAAAWLAENVPPGSWLLDPLGASPALALEAAQAGYRVLVASNNPILSFATETLARAPREADFQSALAELAMSRRGEERLQHHLQSLYRSVCDTCGEQVQPQAYLWRKDEPQPFARLYDCPNCGQNGEHPITQADLERLKTMGGDKLHRARALQRVILNDDAHRADVEEALENYLPRSLYVLFTLANKLEGLGLSPERTRLLQALLISTFDQGSTLWPWPGGRSRPKQLTIPPQFRENNLWLALEDTVKEWTRQPGPIPVTRWPELPPEGTGNNGGICLFRGRVKALMPLPETIRLGAVLTTFPRPNQAFWTLSALWSGWLWGAEAALPLLNVLDRRRYDWNWHTTAIYSALSAVAATIAPETPFFGLLPELAPGFLSAVVTATSAAGFSLEGMALRGEQEFAQGLWRAGAPATARTEARASAVSAPLDAAGRDGSPERAEANTPGATDMESAAREGIRADLQARNEPASYLTEYTAGLCRMAQSGAIPRGLGSIPGDLLNRVQAALARTFADRSLLKVYGGTADEERGAWWLANAPSAPDLPAELPLADRVEIEVVRFMQKQPAFTLEELDQRVCAQFRGLLTPPVDLIRACLESYGEPVPSNAGSSAAQHAHQAQRQPPWNLPWRMRENENAAGRKADLQEVRASLARIGQQLGFTISEQNNALIWEMVGAPAWRFYAMASSILSRYVLAAPFSPSGGQRVLLIPGSRAHLVHYKLRHDPRLAEAVTPADSTAPERAASLFGAAASAGAAGWRFIKFRHLRDIASRADLSLTTWESLLDEDPLTDEATQMSLFGEV